MVLTSQSVPFELATRERQNPLHFFFTPVTVNRYSFCKATTMDLNVKSYALLLPTITFILRDFSRFLTFSLFRIFKNAFRQVDFENPYASPKNSLLEMCAARKHPQNYNFLLTINICYGRHFLMQCVLADLHISGTNCNFNCHDSFISINLWFLICAETEYHTWIDTFGLLDKLPLS